MHRQRTLTRIVGLIRECERDHPIRVGIDGVDAAGKTYLADELALLIRAQDRSVIRASVDGFHNSRAFRYRRGALSPQGYYHDSFNHEALWSELLGPLGPDGSLRYRTAVYDFRTDQPVQSPSLRAERDAVLLFDGVFLQRPELRDAWELTIFVKASFETTLARACARDAGLFRNTAAVRSRYARKYIPGQKLYLEECCPEERADILVLNDCIEDATLSWFQRIDDVPTS